MKLGKKRLEYKYLRDRRQLGEGYVWEAHGLQEALPSSVRTRSPTDASTCPRAACGWPAIACGTVQGS